MQAQVQHAPAAACLHAACSGQGLECSRWLAARCSALLLRLCSAFLALPGCLQLGSLALARLVCCSAALRGLCPRLRCLLRLPVLQALCTLLCLQGTFLLQRVCRSCTACHPIGTVCRQCGGGRRRRLARGNVAQPRCRTLSALGIVQGRFPLRQRRGGLARLAALLLEAIFHSKTLVARHLCLLQGSADGLALLFDFGKFLGTCPGGSGIGVGRGC